MIETIVLGAIWHYFYGTLMTLTAVFLILLVLVQRGRGGGLAGAFGGMGGQSAFGTKAGDTFTKITIGVSVFWILLCVASVKFLGSNTGSFGQSTAPADSRLLPRDPLGEPAATPPATGPAADPATDSAPESDADQSETP